MIIEPAEHARLRPTHMVGAGRGARLNAVNVSVLIYPPLDLLGASALRRSAQGTEIIDANQPVARNYLPPIIFAKTPPLDCTPVIAVAHAGARARARRPIVFPIRRVVMTARHFHASCPSPCRAPENFLVYTPSSELSRSRPIYTAAMCFQRDG